MPSDTPRTDEAQYFALSTEEARLDNPNANSVDASFARQLKRELTHKTEMLGLAKQAVQIRDDEIGRLSKELSAERAKADQWESTARRLASELGWENSDFLQPDAPDA